VTLLEWILLALLFVALVVIVLGALRLRTLAGRTGTFECGFRTLTKTGAHVSLGFAQFRTQRVDWWRCWSLVPHPKRSWRRDRLRVTGHTVLDADARPDYFVVRCEYEGATFELTMSGSAYAGLTSWLEAGPPTTYGTVV
jgi:hypothetical protein